MKGQVILDKIGHSSSGYSRHCKARLEWVKQAQLLSSPKGLQYDYLRRAVCLCCANDIVCYAVVCRDHVWCFLKLILCTMYIVHGVWRYLLYVCATDFCGGFQGLELSVVWCMCKTMCTCGVVYLRAFNCVVWWFPGAREGDPTTRPGAIPRGGNIGATRTKVALSRSLN